MKRTTFRAGLIAVAMLASAAGLRPDEATALTTEEIIKRAYPAIVEIVVHDKAGDETSEGTGFFVAPGRIVTNFHVIEDAYSLCIYPSDRKKDPYTRVKVLKTDRELDLALLEVRDPKQAFLGIGERDTVSLGQPIVVIGNEYDDNILVSEGIVRADVEEGLIVSGMIGPGHSGSPVLDRNGRVIGVIISTRPEGDSNILIFAIKAGNVRGFLKKPDKPRVLPDAGSRLFWPLVWKRVTSPLVAVLKAAAKAGWLLFTLAVKIAAVALIAFLLFRALRGAFRFLKTRYLISKSAHIIGFLTMFMILSFALDVFKGGEADWNFIMARFLGIMSAVLFLLANRARHEARLRRNSSPARSGVQAVISLVIAAPAFIATAAMAVLTLWFPLGSADAPKWPAMPLVIGLLLCAAASWALVVRRPGKRSGRRQTGE